MQGDTLSTIAPYPPIFTTKCIRILIFGVLKYTGIPIQRQQRVLNSFKFLNE